MQLATRTSVDLAIRQVAVPRLDVSDSFTLHAPLELAARVGLLPFVAVDRRADAEAMIAALGARFDSIGAPVREPVARPHDGTESAVRVLAHAIAASDLDEIDATLCWLIEHVPAAMVRRRVAAMVVDSTAAAGHAPIGFHLLHSVADGTLPLSLLRGAVRSIGERPTWRVDWFRGRSAPAVGTSLADAIAAVPGVGRPGSDFIQPIMQQVQRLGLAADLLGPAIGADLEPVAAGRTLLRAAAWSMIHDDPSQAPYGWSHALTMPQGALSLIDDGVDPHVAVSVAATFVAGFRAAHGTVPMAPGALDDDAVRALDDATLGSPSVERLATAAALHHDAHLVKYTLACIHAAEEDPVWAPAFLHAASHLADWWRAHPSGTP